MQIEFEPISNHSAKPATSLALCLLLAVAAFCFAFVEGEGTRYGWYTWLRLGHRLMAAKGHSPGFTAELDRFPKDDVTIILLSNSYGTAPQHEIADALAAIVFGQKAPPPPPLRALAIPETPSYAGQYQ